MFIGTSGADSVLTATEWPRVDLTGCSGGIPTGSDKRAIKLHMPMDLGAEAPTPAALLHTSGAEFIYSQHRC